jgi:hypothetical protein
MPQLLQKMLDAGNFDFKVYQSTYAGISLGQHISRKICQEGENNVRLCPLKEGDTSTTDKMLYERKWDFVVLQEGTVRLLIPEAKIFQTIPAIKEIQSRHKNNVSQFILFKTWPNRDTFPKQFCYPKAIIDKTLKKENCCSPLMKSKEEEYSLINAGYDTVSFVTNVPSVPITNCFADISKNHPNINLYEDKSHPSIFGAYLNACVFYKYLTKQNAVDIKYAPDFDKVTVRTIQETVDRNFP